MGAFKTYKKYWISLFLILVTTFSIMGFVGIDIYREAPPIPLEIVSEDGKVILTEDDILTGQTVWQSIGGQQVGSIWGHGAYQAPDWSADWLHRELVFLLNKWANADYGLSFENLDEEKKAVLQIKLKKEVRTNRYKNGVLTLSDDRVEAFYYLSDYYMKLFGDAPELNDLREDYAIQNNPIPDINRRKMMPAFFFWTSWACATNRPNMESTYTNNWPHEPLISNTPTASNLLWSIVSIFLLIAAVGALIWYKAFKHHEEDPLQPPSDPFSKFTLTPSMKSLWMYCAVILLLFVLQVTMGAITAHYTVEGQAFFGYNLSEILPYSVTRTWHIQLGLFWIATSFLAAGLFLAPIIGGKEPKYQDLGVKILLGALVVIVFGSLTCEYLAIMQKLDLEDSFFIGTQGYEYIELGRVWQIGLFTGLIIWLGLVLRALLPAFKRNDSNKGLIAIFTGASTAIGLFYGVGLFIGAKTHLSVMEFWRWWVVHLWVEGFFEVFATAAIGTIFTFLGLIRPKHATRAVLFSTCIFLVAGIPGTFHHLYFSGTTSLVSAVGSIFSALEIVPLLLLGIEAKETMSLRDATPWMKQYKWPITFFIGVAFWNLVGAGIFGFLINPPISLYYMQGLNTTPVHAHTAVFGVYGLLSLGFVLLIARRYTAEYVWNDKLISRAFWGMNIGLAVMVGISILPVGILQVIESVQVGLWSARSAEFMQQDHMQFFRWSRIIGDTMFLAGVAYLVWFCIGLKTGHSLNGLIKNEIKTKKALEV